MAPDEYTREFDALWKAIEKQSEIIASLRNQYYLDRAEDKAEVAVLKLKSQLWTIVGAFIATAMWFVRDIFTGRKIP